MILPIVSIVTDSKNNMFSLGFIVNFNLFSLSLEGKTYLMLVLKGESCSS